MKSLMITASLILVSWVSSLAQDYEYLVETTGLDSFVVIENGKERLIQSPRVDNTQFLFNCSNPKQTSIRVHCAPCEVQLTIKLFGKKEDSYTQWINLDHLQTISISECFEKFPKKTGLSAFFSNPMDKLISFWNSFNNGRTARRRTPILKSGGAEPDDPKLDFLKTDYSYYLNIEDFSIQLRNLEHFPVKSMYIISHEGELLFHSGDTQILDNIFDLKGKTIPEIESVLQLVKSEKEGKIYELRWKEVQTYLFEDFKAGRWYQLGVELEGDESDHNPYLFNFQFYTKAQLKELERFFIRE